MTSACSEVAIVTGSNKGIGYAIVRALCERFDGDVYLTARDADRGRRAVEGLRELGLRPRFHRLDVTDGRSVAEFRDFVRHNHRAGIRVLVNNAGVDAELNFPDRPFAEQAEAVVRVNYFGMRAVCDALFPLLAARARVVNVSSSFARLSLMRCDRLRDRFASPRLTVRELDDLMREYLEAARSGDSERLAGWPEWAYSASKIAVHALTRVQQRTFDAEPAVRDVIVNSVHPGFVMTDLTKNLATVTGVQQNTVYSAEQAATAPVHLALLPDGERHVRGQYVWCDATVRDWHQ